MTPSASAETSRTSQATEPEASEDGVGLEGTGPSPAGPSTDQAAGARWERWYLVGLLLVVVGSVALLELLYAQAPIPPGVDPGDWIMRSYAFVGRAHPPVDAIGSPYLYPPAIFVPLGFLYYVTGSPMLTGDLFAGLLLALYGLSCIFLAQNFFRQNAPKLLFVGFAVFNGLTFSMLFWGGYPNFLGLALMNVAFVGLLRLLRKATLGPALLLFGTAALLYLTHSFSFVLLIIGVLGALLFVVLAEPRRIRNFVNLNVLAGLALLVATIGLYTGLSDYYGVQHPSYLYGNPAAFTIDKLGELFQPMAGAPVLLPSGPPVYLTDHVMFALLAGSALVLLVASVAIDRLRPGVLTDPIRIAAGWLAASLFLPDLGYLAKVATDYTRFVYFLPVPAGLLAVLVLERIAESFVLAPSPAPPGTSGPAAAPALARGMPSDQVRRIAFVGAVVAVVLMFLVVTLPTGLQNESTDTGRSHGSEFLQAADWLAQNSTPGSVLTTETIARWTEAITTRGAFDPGPTWLLFEPWQVQNSEWAYWSLNSVTAVTNNEAAFGFSPAGAGTQAAAPLYAPFVLGIPDPAFRVLPSGTTFTTTSANGTSGWTLASLPTALSSAQGTAQSALWDNYTAPTGSVVEQVTPATTGGLGWINFTLVPAPGDEITGFSLDLANSPTNDPVLHAGQLMPITATGPTLNWDISSDLGQEPSKTVTSTTTTLSPAPESIAYGEGQVHNSATARFVFSPAPGARTVSVEVRTAGTSNPAVTLPSILSTAAFFQSLNIHFVFLPASANYVTTLDSFRVGLGFREVYANSEWVILAN